MPDEATTAPENETQNSPTEDAAPDLTDGAPAPESAEDSTPAGPDYEKRYNDMRSEFDRTRSVLSAAQGHQGPEAQAEALRQLGVEVEMAEQEQENDDEWTDPDDRIEKLEQWKNQREEAEQEAHFQKLEESYIKSTLGELETKDNMKLSDREERIVVNNALANRLDDGRPDLQGAFDDLKGIKSAARDEYLVSKKAPRAPVGAAGEETIDFSKMNSEEKRQWMAEDLAARRASMEES